MHWSSIGVSSTWAGWFKLNKPLSPRRRGSSLLNWLGSRLRGNDKTILVQRFLKCWPHACGTRRRPQAATVALGITALCLSLQAGAATNISGVVTDSITGQAIAGARVSVTGGQSALGVGTTEPDGVFQLFVAVPVSPVPQTLNLEAVHPGYGPRAINVFVTSGQADQLSYKLPLLRNEAKGCAPASGRMVVVGHVRSPASASRDLVLSQRVGEVLQYDLLTETQKIHLPSAQQPMVLACPDAQPRVLGEHQDWARSLKADAFVVGSAASVDTRFKVDLQVTARYADAPALPALVSTPPMNLDLPPSADLGRAALEPIMIALLRGYLKENRYPECVEFSVAAEHALGKSALLTGLRKACQDKLPNKGLLTGGGQ